MNLLQNCSHINYIVIDCTGDTPGDVLKMFVVLTDLFELSCYFFFILCLLNPN